MININGDNETDLNQSIQPGRYKYCHSSSPTLLREGRNGNKSLVLLMDGENWIALGEGAEITF